MLNKGVGIGLVASSLLLSVATAQVANAQGYLQTPSGHQKVSPSEMPQQPNIGEELTTGKGTQRVIPNAAPDLPGVPNIVSPSTGGETVSPETPGVIPNSTHKKNQAPTTGPGSKIPQSAPTAPGASVPAGTLIAPSGIPSSVRIGPLEPIPTWQRAVLASFLLFQMVFMAMVAVALYLSKSRHDDIYQAGKTINEDFREDWLRKPSRQT